jgi:hypothetical protein
VGEVLEVERGRREQHQIGVLAEELDDAVGLRRRQVLDHLGADDEVVARRQGVGCLRQAAVGTHRFVHAGDCVLRAVDSFGGDAARPQRLDEDAERAADVEDRLRGEIGDQPIGLPTEVAQPALVALIAMVGVGPVIVLVVKRALFGGHAALSITDSSLSVNRARATMA